MTPTVRSFLIASFKNGVNAIITNAALIAAIHDQFNLSTANGWVHIAKLTVSVVLAREAVVWGPKLLAWSQDGSDSQIQTKETKA